MGNRPDRVGEAIREELSRILMREVHDPAIGFITLTRVTVTSDLQIARVYYTTLGDEKAQRETEKALKRASPFLRRQLGSRIRLRRVPEVTFFYDASIGHTDRVEQILRDLKTEADSRQQSEEATAAEPGERAGDDASTEPREQSERAGGSGGAKPPGQE